MCKWKKKSVNLTVTEFLLIKSLVKNIGVVKSRDQLIFSAFGEDKENIDDIANDMKNAQKYSESRVSRRVRVV